jgi:hypothetical protein
MPRNSRVRVGHKRAVEILSEWTKQKRPAALAITIGKKFNITFPDGRLVEIGKDLGLFYHVTVGAFNFVSPQAFKRCEREQESDYERLIFSDPGGDDIMMIGVSKNSKPIPLEKLSGWIN